MARSGIRAKWCRVSFTVRFHKNVLNEIYGANFEVPGESELPKQMGHRRPVPDERFRLVESLGEPSGPLEQGQPIVAPEAFQVLDLESRFPRGALNREVRSYAVAWKILFSGENDCGRIARLRSFAYLLNDHTATIGQRPEAVPEYPITLVLAMLHHAHRDDPVHWPFNAVGRIRILGAETQALA